MEILKNKTVLIVDDESANIYALRNYLETVEMKIEVAYNGEEAITFLSEKKSVDIILLDMMMPIMDGYEMLHVLRNSDSLKHIPVIAFTAKAMKGDREKCLEAGAWGYISKPVNLKILIDLITQWV
ncbi:MAG TPA: response regulator [Cytophagaceae bacterium]|jgi:two-component system chemotaxis sensor kinase CheA|nr:response regulator [Cytophagaceae bacterium]